MGTRAVLLDCVVFLLWAFVCFFYLGVIGFNVLFSILGVVSGLIFGIIVALRYIKSLEKKGEIKVTFKTLAFMWLTIGIILGIVLYFLFSLELELEALILINNFVYPFIPALYAARIALYMNWERKHRKHILFEGLVLTRVYAVPTDLECRVG